MKKLLLQFLFLNCISELQAQVTFCPPGAKWSYLFNAAYPISFGVLENRAAIYLGDSILNGQQVKVILSHRFFRKGDYYSGIYTLIRQSGDTIFLRNQWTNHKWQVLYNFAALPGHNWTNTFTVGSTVTGYTTTVDSVGTRAIGNNTLKELKVFYSNTLGDFGSGLITERIGSNGHLFNYRCNYHIHSETFAESLCYQDNDIGVVQFSNKPCNYSNSVGISNDFENTVLRVYPNPVSDILNIESDENLKIIILDLKGRILKQEELYNQKINTSDLAPGLYFLQITKQNESVYMTKIVKE